MEEEDNKIAISIHKTPNVHFLSLVKRYNTHLHSKEIAEIILIALDEGWRHLNSKGVSEIERFPGSLSSFCNFPLLMKALVLESKGSPYENFKLNPNFPTPTPSETQVLVKIEATSLNPVDWKMAKIGFLIPSFPVVLGCDMAGTVAEIGSKVTNFKVGDEVYAFTHLGTPNNGTFAEYCLIEQDILSKKPKNLSFPEASTLGVGSLTAASGLYYFMQLPLPSKPTDKSEHILIWGASSSVGWYAVQLAALSGFTVIAVCSKRNFENVKALGATHLIDYNSEDVVARVKEITGGNLKYAFDMISEETASKCAEALTTSGSAQLAYIAGAPKNPPAHVKVHSVFIGGGLSKPEERSFFIQMYGELLPLLESGKVKPNQPEELPNGLSGIPQGLQRMFEGKVSATKLFAIPSKT